MGTGLLAARCALTTSRAWRRAYGGLVQRAFAQHGKRLRVDPRGSFTHDTVFLGDDVSIGVGAVLWAVSPAYIEIRDKVMLGPRVTIIAGDHIFDVPGAFMADQHVKRVGDDLPVIIERDVWIGANVTILKGVTVGRGSVIAAGSVVIGSVPPYSVVAGVPAEVIRPRFTPEQQAAHEEFLGAERSIRPGAEGGC